MTVREPISLAEPDQLSLERFQGSGSQLLPGIVEVEFVAGYVPPERGEDEEDGVVAIFNRNLLLHLYSRERALRAQGWESHAILSPPRRNVWRLTFPATADVVRIGEELRSLSNVIDAAPEPDAHPADPFDEELLGTTILPTIVKNKIQNQWYIFRCGVDAVWSKHQLSGAGVIIADVDWGFRPTHVDLKPKFDTGLTYNAVDGRDIVTFGRRVYHGTAVAGLALASDVQDIGMVGIAYGATLWAIQANEGKQSVFEGNSWANAIDWVRNKKTPGQRKIIILEVQTGDLHNYEEVKLVNQAIREAVAENIVVCVPAGNGPHDAGFTAAGKEIPATGSVLVAATVAIKKINRRAPKSNYGKRIVASAPGSPDEDVTCSAAADSKYTNCFGGTSGAAPKVAGVIALMLQANPALCCKDINSILKSGKPVESEFDREVGGGFLDAEAAVGAAIALRPRFELFVRTEQEILRVVRSSPGVPWAVSFQPKITECVAGGHRDGSTVIIGRGDRDDTLWSWDAAAADDLPAPVDLGPFRGALTVVAGHDGRTDLFGTAEGRLWHKRRDTTACEQSAAWTEIGKAQGELTAIVDVEGCIRVFGFGPDERLWQLRSAGDRWIWRPFADRVPPPGSSLQTAVNLDGRVEIFASAPDGELFHVWQVSSDAWSDWHRFRELVKTFTVLRDALGRLNLLLVDRKGHLRHVVQDSPNSDRWIEGRRIDADVDEVAGGLNGNGIIELFGRTADGVLRHFVYDERQDHWNIQAIPDVAVTGLTAVQMC